MRLISVLEIPSVITCNTTRTKGQSQHLNLVEKAVKHLWNFTSFEQLEFAWLTVYYHSVIYRKAVV